MGIKLFECAICKRLTENNVKGEERVIGDRKTIREHLRKIHHIKGRKNFWGVNKKEFGKSDISKNCILYKEY